MHPVHQRPNLRRWLYAGVSFAALAAAGVPGKAAQVTNNHDGPTTVNSGDTVTFGANTTAGTLGQDEARIADGLNIGAGGIVVSPTTQSSGGILTFVGNGTATGTIGASGHSLLALWTAGGSGTTATVTGDAWLNVFYFSANQAPGKAGGLIEVQGNVTSSGVPGLGSFYFGVDGTVKLSGANNVMGLGASVTSNGTGNIIINNTGTTSIAGAVGASTRKLASFSFDKAGTVTFGSNAFMNSLTFKADGSAIFNQDAATTITTPITNASGSAAQGTVVLATSNKGAYTVTGNVGAAGAGTLKRLEIGASGRTGTVTLKGDLFADDTQFATDSALTLAGTYNGTITTASSGTGTFNMLSGTATGGDIGTLLAPLKAVEFQAGANSLNHGIMAKLVTVASGATLSVGAPGLAVSVAGGGLVNKGTIALAGHILKVGGDYGHGGGAGALTLTIGSASGGMITVGGNVDTTGGLTVTPTVSGRSIVAGDKIVVIDVLGSGTTTLASATATPGNGVTWSLVKATAAEGTDIFGNPIGSEDVYLLAPTEPPPTPPTPPPIDPPVTPPVTPTIDPPVTPPAPPGTVDTRRAFFTLLDPEGSGTTITFDGGVLKAQESTRTGQPMFVMSSGGTIDGNGRSVTLTGEVTGDGTLTVTGGGEVHMNSMVSVPVLVDQTGVLRGTGTITGPTSVFGTLAPGNSPGTLTFNASVTMQSSGTLALDIDGTGTGSGAGNYSRVIVNGGSFTAAGTLAPRLRGITYSNFETPGTDSYTPPLGQRFAGVVQASGGVLGGFSSLTQPAGLAAGTRFDALYGTNAIDLIVTPALFGNLGVAGLAQSASQSALGAALDVVRPAAGTVMTSAQSSVFGTLYGLAPGAITVALDQLSPLIYADAMMTARNGWGLMAGAIGGQMASRRGLAADSDVNTAPGPNGSTIWISALGQYSATRAGGGSPGYSAGIGGTAAGIDMPVDPDTMLGVAIGASGGKVWGQSGGQATVSTGQLQFYGQWRHEAWFVEAQLGGLYQQSSVRRDMGIFGVTARGTVDGFAGGGGVRAGMQHRVDGWLIEPSVSFGGFAFTQNGITESGAGAMSAAIARQTLGSAQSTLGISAQRGFALTDDVYVVAKGRLGWAHEFAANRGIVRASLSGLAGSGFTQSSAPIGRDAALIGLSADAKVKDWPVSFFVGYGGAFSGSSNAQTITAGVRFVW